MDRRPGTANRRRLEDEFYKVMSRFTNVQWKEFARSKQRGLALPDYQIDDIRADYHNDIREQKYQMLSLWQRRNGRKATVEYLDQLVDNFVRLPPPEQRQGNIREAEPLTHDVGHRVPEGDDSISDGGNPRPSAQTARPEARDPVAGTARPVEAAVHSSDHSMPARTIRPDTMDQDQAVHGASLEAHAYSSMGPGGNHHAQSRSTRPKETTGVTQGIASAKSAASAFGIFDNSNININVLGSHAIGIQNNVYHVYNGKPQKRKPKVENLQKFSEYCTKIEKVEVVQSTAESYETHWDKLNDIYKVSHKPKGAVLIINNSFPGQPDERHGSQVDLQNMEILWQKLGCKVFLKTEIKAAEAIRCFDKFASTSSVCASDFVVFVVMSHGGLVKGKDVFYGEDREPVVIKDVLDRFDNRKAAKLQGTPKLFFFQVCRGTDVDMGADASPTEAAAVVMESLERTVRQSSGVAPVDSSDAMGFQAATPGALPTMSDTMISYATQAGNRAFRNTEMGSWYINAITNVFMRHSHDEHVLELMTKVNNAVAGKTAHNADDPALHGGKEMSDFTSTLRKKLFFFPGFPKDEDDDFL